MKREFSNMLVGAFLAVVLVFIGQSHFSFRLDFLNMMKISTVLLALIGYYMHSTKSRAGRLISLILFAVAFCYIALHYGWATSLMNEIGIDRSDLPDFEPIVLGIAAIVVILFLLATTSYVQKQTRAATFFLILFGVVLTFGIAGLG